MENIFAIDLGALNQNSISKVSTISKLVDAVVQNAFVLAGLISFVILVFGGFSVIMGAGAGDAKKMEQGQKAITGAVLGLIIVLVSFWIVQILERVTGTTLLQLPQ